jgi:hypothetical protein
LRDINLNRSGLASILATIAAIVGASKFTDWYPQRDRVAVMAR